jgi:hypothetical protein
MFDQNAQNQPAADATAPVTQPAAPVEPPAVDPTTTTTPVAPEPTAVSTPAVEPADEPAVGGFTTLPATEPAAPAEETAPADVPAPTPDPAPVDLSASTDSPADEPASDSAPVGDSNLLSIKQQALQNLSPLLDQLEQSPEEKFRTTMMMIQASDDQSLLQTAYDAANAITDEKAKAQALLDVVNEINYFTQANSSNSTN